MNCAAYDKMLARRLAGDLCGADRERLESHLRSCPACSARWASYEALGRGLSDLHATYARIAPPFTFRPGKPATADRNLRRRVFVFARAGLATAAAIALTFVGWQHLVRDPEPESRAERTGTPMEHVTSMKPFPQTAPVWPRISGSASAAQSRVVRVPTFTNVSWPAEAAPSSILFRTPSLMLKPRSHSHVDDAQDDRNGGIAPVDGSATGGDFGSGSATA